MYVSTGDDAAGGRLNDLEAAGVGAATGAGDDEAGDCAGAEVGVCVEADAGVGAAAAALELDVVPFDKSTTFLFTSFPAKNSAALNVASTLGAGGKISLWKESAFLGTINAIGSTALPCTFTALAISQSPTLNARRGRNAIPRCGSLALCSERRWTESLSARSYS